MTQLCADLGEEAERKWRYRQRLTYTFLVGFCLLSFLLLNGSTLGGIFASSGIVLLMGCVLASFGLAISSKSERIMKRLALTRDTRTVVPLLNIMRGSAEMRHTDSNSNRLLWNTLALLLPILSETEGKTLLETHGEDIRAFLAGLRPSHLLVTQAEFALGVSMLDLIQRCRDTKLIATVKSLAVTPTFRKDFHPLRAQARECLVVLEEQKRKEEQGRMLLRPSAGTLTEQAELLLRPAGNHDTADAQELLRANVS